MKQSQTHSRSTTPLPLVATVLALVAAGSTSCINVPVGETSASWQLGGGAEFGGDGDSDGTVIHAEAEFVLADNLTVAGRLLAYDYEYEDEEFGEFEEGSGEGLGAEIRYYPKSALDGFYIGAGIGVYPTAEYDYREPGFTESDDGTSVDLHAAVGYAFRMERFSITPTLILGNYSGVTREVGGFGGIGLRLGYAF